MFKGVASVNKSVYASKPMTFGKLLGIILKVWIIKGIPVFVTHEIKKESSLVLTPDHAEGAIPGKAPDPDAGEVTS